MQLTLINDLLLSKCIKRCCFIGYGSVAENRTEHIGINRRPLLTLRCRYKSGRSGPLVYIVVTSPRNFHAVASVLLLRLLPCRHTMLQPLQGSVGPDRFSVCVSSAHIHVGNTQLSTTILRHFRGNRQSLNGVHNNLKVTFHEKRVVSARREIASLCLQPFLSCDET